VPKLAALGMVAIALGLAGCSVDSPRDGSGDRSKTQGDPRPAESLEQFERRFQAAVASPNCDGYPALVEFIPPSCRETKRRFAGIRFTGSEQYGTGAVVDAVAPVERRGITLALALDEDRRWKALNIYGTRTATVESRARDLIPFDVAAGRWVAAARARNCEDYLRYTELNKRGPAEAVCGSEFGDERRVPSALSADRAARAVRMGGNARFQFYKLKIRPDRYGTFAVRYFPGEARAMVTGPLFVR
jgi:hypothetical protein